MFAWISLLLKSSIQEEKINLCVFIWKVLLLICQFLKILRLIEENGFEGWNFSSLFDIATLMENLAIARVAVGCSSHFTSESGKQEY